MAISTILILPIQEHRISFHLFQSPSVSFENENKSVICSVMSNSTVPSQALLSMKFFQVRILEWVAISFPGDLPDPGIEPRYSAFQADALTSEPPGKCHAFSIIPY